MNDHGSPSHRIAERPVVNVRLQQIAAEMQADRLESAEAKLREFLQQFPDDTAALMLMARLMDRSGKTARAASVLAQCLMLQPDFAAARFARSHLLFRLHRYRVALAEVEKLLTQDERDPRYRKLAADILVAMGEESRASEILKGLVAEAPGRAEPWLLYGTTLRALGKQNESIAAYRRAIQCRRSCGWAWGSLGDIKGFQFSEADIRVMQTELTRPDIPPDDRTHLLFALGMAFEDLNDYRQAFDYYKNANTSSRQRHDGAADSIRSRAGRIKSLITPNFLQSRADSGCKAPDPIFVVGRPRSGSTLVEQILASHSAIEGAGELPYIKDLVQGLCDGELGPPANSYPELVEQLDQATLSGLGESYLESAAVHRKMGRKYFVDKMPGNFLHVGLIHLMLPNAKIIDVRRNPAATCVSMFKHYLGKSNFLLEELGSIYREYVGLMAHFDGVLPGRVHRVIYEALIADPERQIRGLFEYLDLPFEEACLNYHSTERAVRTPSSEQVRRPIFGDAVDEWRRFEPWLGPLIESLGSVLTAYPGVPVDLS